MNSLHLTPLGPNVTEVRYGARYVLFSYQTPVAFMDENGQCYKTSKKHSKTTSKHVNQWLNGRIGHLVTQETIDALVK